jgi:ABC-type lipoprotein export system ATPase subunit
MPDEVIIRGEHLTRAFGAGEAAVTAIKDASIEIRSGVMVAIMGKSGSGKSTLVNLLSGLDKPTSGRVMLLGKDLARLSEAEMADMRAQHIGFVLQKDNLIPSLTIEENVAAPLVMSGMRLSQALPRARKVLADIGLDHRARAWPAQVSGGEAQRAAVARSCVGSPAIVFADEPTGALDRENGRIVRDTFRELVGKRNAVGILATHDMDLAGEADILISIADGQIVSQIDQRI